MGLALIVLALYGQALCVSSCRPKEPKGQGGGVADDDSEAEGETLPNIFWEPDGIDQAMWNKWLEEYKKNMKNSGEKDAGIMIDDGRPLDWQGYGPGSGGVAPPPWAYFPGAYGKPDLCFQEPDVGHCKETLDRWGYNAYTKKCLEFKYSGCGGNDNNFITKQRCEITCSIDVATNCQIFDG